MGKMPTGKAPPKPPMAIAPQPTMISASVPMNSATYFFMSPVPPPMLRDCQSFPRRHDSRPRCRHDKPDSTTGARGCYPVRCGRSRPTNRRKKSMQSRYVMFAAYNRWANERLYDAVAGLSDTDYRADRGAFFKSVHGTLNHLLVGD